MRYKALLHFFIFPFYLFAQTEVSTSKIVVDTLCFDVVQSSSIQSYFIEFNTRDTGRWEQVNHNFNLPQNQTKNIAIDWRADMRSIWEIYGVGETINRQFTTAFRNFEENSMDVYVWDSLGSAPALKFQLHLTYIKND
tara:strand:+ start:1788 stop:2201 length:414 start_codon:yes stop_codon:yes gene_type:complete